MTKAVDARQFTITEAKREAVPLWVGLFSPSGGGKTLSAIRLAVGIQRVVGGDIGFVDTESRRALAYAGVAKFRHVDFKAPFRSLDYLAAVRQLVAAGCKTVIVDSMSHEHEGPGGMVDFQEAELDRMAGDDYAKRERMKMLAWAKPKASRRELLNGLLQENVNLILCFRAKNTSKPVKVGNKTEVVQMGFMPIAGDEFVYECMLAALFMPGAKGVPTWESENVGERTMIKLPLQFEKLAAERGPMSEEIGERLATWARGAPTRAPEEPKGQPMEEVVDFPADQGGKAPPAGQEAPPAGAEPQHDAQVAEEPKAAGEPEKPEPRKIIPGGAPADVVYFLAAESGLNDVGRRQTFKNGKPHSSALPTNTDVPIYALHAGATEAGPEITNNPESREPPADEPQSDGGQAEDGFAAYADALAGARTWEAIGAALAGVMKSEAWASAGKPMQCRARALAHARTMELVAQGVVKVDFVTNAHAWRNYLEAETDIETFKFNRGAFEGHAAFTGLPAESRAVLTREADRRELELMSTSTGFE